MKLNFESTYEDLEEILDEIPASSNSSRLCILVYSDTKKSARL